MFLPLCFWLRLRRRRLPTNLRSQCRIHRVTDTLKTLNLRRSVRKLLVHLPSQLAERPCDAGFSMRTRRITELGHQLLFCQRRLSIAKRCRRCRRKMITDVGKSKLRCQTALFAIWLFSIVVLFDIVLVRFDEMRIRHQPARRHLETREPSSARNHRVSP